MKKTNEALLKKRNKLLEKIVTKAYFIKGSMTKITRNGKKTDSYYLTYKNENQKTCTKYITQKESKQALAGIANMKKIKKLIDEVSELNIEILKNN